VICALFWGVQCRLGHNPKPTPTDPAAAARARLHTQRETNRQYTAQQHEHNVRAARSLPTSPRRWNAPSTRPAAAAVWPTHASPSWPTTPTTARQQPATAAVPTSSAQQHGHAAPSQRRWISRRTSPSSVAAAASHATWSNADESACSSGSSSVWTTADAAAATSSGRRNDEFAAGNGGYEFGPWGCSQAWIVSVICLFANGDYF
jgi:hypothetical protein